MARPSDGWGGGVAMNIFEIFLAKVGVPMLKIGSTTMENKDWEGGGE